MAHFRRPTLFALGILSAGILVAVLTPRVGLSIDTSPKNFVAESPTGRAEVLLEYPNRKVEVKLLDRDRYGLPDAVEISLFDGKGKRTDLELSAVAAESRAPDRALQRRYFGTIPAGEESYVGVAIRIPFTRAPVVSTLKTGVLK